MRIGLIGRKLYNVAEHHEDDDKQEDNEKHQQFLMLRGVLEGGEYAHCDCIAKLALYGGATVFISAIGSNVIALSCEGALIAQHEILRLGQLRFSWLVSCSRFVVHIHGGSAFTSECAGNVNVIAVVILLSGRGPSSGGVKIKDVGVIKTGGGGGIFV